MTPLLHTASFFAILLGIFALAFPSTTRAQEEIDCRPVVENFRQNVESAPTHVLTLLEDVLIANGGHCVPKFVQAAIEASSADAATVKKIVFVAITNAQAQAPQIAEAAVSAAPNHADAVRAAFADAFKDDNPRLKPADPSSMPAWAQENAPVPKPKVIPAPKIAKAPEPAPKPVPAPIPAPVLSTPKSQEAPSMVTNQTKTPFELIEDQGDPGWNLLHDGVVDPIDPQGLSAWGEVPGGEAPPAVEPELPDMKKKRFGFFLPKLPSLPALPETDAPIDLFFHGPFGGVPPVVNQDS